MQLEFMIVAAAANLFAAAALSLAPVWSRPGMLFGVRVGREYRASRQGRLLLRNFRLKVWAATALALALTVISGATAAFWLQGMGLALQVATAIFAFRAAWLEAKPHGLPAPATRTAHLFAPPPHVPGGPLAVATPFLLIAGVSAYLASHWSAIPARFPIHWDSQGHPNGWADRTFFGVFGPALIAFGILIFIAILMAGIIRSSRRATEGSGLSRRNQAMLVVPVIVMWVIAIMFSLVSLTPLILRNGQFPIPAFALILVPIAAVFAGFWYAARASAEPDDLPDDNTPNDCWKWGQIYYNPADPSIMVEKRFGLGYTLNFARWQSWAMLCGVVAMPFVIIALMKH